MTTVTSSAEHSGTDAGFYYTLTGTKGKTAEYYPDNPGDDKELGKTDTYTITDDTDIGEFRCVSIRIHSGDNDGWLITEVKIFNIL